jgi:hypothetical protein
VWLKLAHDWCYFVADCATVTALGIVATNPRAWPSCFDAWACFFYLYTASLHACRWNVLPLHVYIHAPNVVSADRMVHHTHYFILFVTIQVFPWLELFVLVLPSLCRWRCSLAFQWCWRVLVTSMSPWWWAVRGVIDVVSRFDMIQDWLYIFEDVCYLQWQIVRYSYHCMQSYHYLTCCSYILSACSLSFAHWKLVSVFVL